MPIPTASVSSNVISMYRIFVVLPSYYQLVRLDIRIPRLKGLQLFNTIKNIEHKYEDNILFCS